MWAVLVPVLSNREITIAVAVLCGLALLGLVIDRWQDRRTAHRPNSTRRTS
jgi:hypothetical protein